MITIPCYLPSCLAIGSFNGLHLKSNFQTFNSMDINIGSAVGPVVAFVVRAFGLAVVFFISKEAAKQSSSGRARLFVTAIIAYALMSWFFVSDAGTHSEQSEDYDGIRGGGITVVDREASAVENNTKKARVFLFMCLAGLAGIHLGIKDRAKADRGS